MIKRFVGMLLPLAVLCVGVLLTQSQLAAGVTVIVLAFIGQFAANRLITGYYI